ncbi:D-methionine transport system substrate-binding protein [Orbus hercynius]|uniref:D-methionine transport system substrate-binding protein n=1 Tax=Orbus hercynius TaxID=593135 RepID=A0A495RKR5_9GAMM|nr:MetQ/NlpA family ABC transporter substrate-binding protein [Orbus hercynius]RKS87378.1 D-methionine transport system substrate-binding protein [Orbus hercynius]
MKSLLKLVLPLFFITGLVACDKNDNSGNAQRQQVINVGTSPGPYSELFLTAIKPILVQDGYKVEVFDFSNLRLADIALNDGDIDLNVDQHSAYYQDFNQSAGADLVAITQIPTVPAGLYAANKTSLAQIAKGDKVAIPQDPSNAARAYALLQKAGWITLKPGTVLTKASASDISENKYGINIIELDSATIPRSLADLDYAIIPGSVAYAANVDISKVLLQEDLLDHLILVATVKASNKDKPWAQAVVAAYHSDAFKAYLDQHNQNHYWFIPEQLK